MILLRCYDRLVLALAIVAATSLGLCTFLIVVDVMLRNVGVGPIQPASALVEYALLFSTMAGGPWLVRRHGHIAVTSFVEKLPAAPRRLVGQAVLIVSTLALTLLCWRSAAVALEEVATGATDIRSIAIPGWVLYLMLSIGFGLMAVEFLRLLLRGEVYAGTEGGIDAKPDLSERAAP